MMNLSSFKAIPPHKRNFFVLSIAIILLVGGALIWYILRESEKFGFDDGGAFRSGRISKAMSPEGQVRKVLTESKSFAGIIEQITTPKDGGVKFLRIRASVVDESKLSESDFSAGSHDLPMREEIFDAVVTAETKFSSDAGFDSIHSGMAVTIRTKESLSSKEGPLTIESLDVLGNSVPASGPSPRAEQK